MKLGEMLNVYGILGKATMNTLKVEDVLKAFKFRKAARPHVEEWNAFLKDIQEKGRNWEAMSDEEKAELNRALEAELTKDVDIAFDKISVEAAACLVQENSLKPQEIDLSGIMEE